MAFIKRRLKRYISFQLPGWLIAILMAYWAYSAGRLRLEWAIALVLFWFLKDLVLYPFVKHAYKEGSSAGRTGLLGRGAITTERIDPEGYVRVGGAYWKARSVRGPIEAGRLVTVESEDGLTLIVKESD